MFRTACPLRVGYDGCGDLGCLDKVDMLHAPNREHVTVGAVLNDEIGLVSFLGNIKVKM